MTNQLDYVYGEEAAAIAGFQKACHLLRVLRKHGEAYEHDTGKRVATVKMMGSKNWVKAVSRDELEAFLAWYEPIRNKNPRNGGRAVRSIVVNSYKTVDTAERKRREQKAIIRQALARVRNRQEVDEW